MSPKFVKSMVIIAGICVIGGIGGFVMLKMLPPKPDWLYGRWWYDAPENVPQDSLWFRPGGRMEFRSEDNKVLRRCRYTTLVENQVNVRCRSKDRAEDFVYKFQVNNGIRDLRDKTGKIYFKQ